MEAGAPPSIIWQKRPSVEPFKAVEENVSAVPGATEPVFVTVRVGFARRTQNVQ